jgi:glycosyltransferase involved in cell wall biosynthesis
MTSVAGMERHLLTLLPGLRACGLDVSLIILVEADKSLDAYPAQMSDLGVPTEQLVMQRDLDLGIIWRLARKFRESGCDAIHTHLIHADLHGIIAAKLAGVKHIYFTGHNDDSFRHRLPIRLLQSFLWRQVEAGITISEALRQFVINVEFAPPSRVHTVHYGLDPSKVVPVENARSSLRQMLGLAPNTPIAGSVCRLTTQKGVTYAIQAFQGLPDAHYVIVGDGPLRNTLETEVHNHQLEDRVHFLGWRDDIHHLMAGFDVLLMPSLWEGFGLVALEAMAVCTPIIASRVSALPEIVVDGETGYLVPPADPTALAARLRDIFNDPDKARLVGENGRKRLESEFSVQRMVESTLKVYGLKG